MTTVLETNATQAVSPAVSAMQDIPLLHIQESKTNPRRLFDETKLAELAANIRQHGVLQPVLVRPLPGGDAGFYELVAGARRYRASKLAGRETIPATVRELTDTECLELQLDRELATRRRARTRRSKGLCRPYATSTGHLYRRNAGGQNRTVGEIRVCAAPFDPSCRRCPTGFLHRQADRGTRV